MNRRRPGTAFRIEPLLRRIFQTLLLPLLLTPGAAALAENWPQWRGPHLDGTSRETNLPLHWSVGQGIAWRLPLPARGAATPIVWDDRIFLSVGEASKKRDQISLWCVDRNTGEILWTRPLSRGDVRQHKHTMSSPSPVTDGERVWVVTGSGVLKAFTFEGKNLWSLDLQAEHGKFGIKWGYASSPLLFEDSLFLQVVQGFTTTNPSFLLRIDGATGKTRWRVDRPTDAVAESLDAYSTPGLLRYGGKTEIVITGGDVVTGHKRRTGRELWRAGGLNPKHLTTQRLVASPLVANGLIYAFGKKGPVLALRPGGRGDVTESHLVWTWEKGTDVPTPVTDGKYLYIVNDHGIIWCLDARTGKVLWGPKRLKTGTYSASPVLADGRIYATNEHGFTTVVQAGSHFEILAENDLSGYTLASPAISDGQIFIRTGRNLFAIGARVR